MAYDLEEQEQLENVKAWWAQYGKWVSNLITLVLIAVCAWYGYKWWQSDQLQKAQLLNEKIDAALIAKQKNDVLGAAKELLEKYPKTEHAALGILKAVYSLKESDPAVVINMLEELVKKQQGPYKTLVEYRLSGIFLEQNKIDQAQKYLAQTPTNKTWAALFNERQADILIIKGDKQGAIKLYQNTLDYAKQVKNQAWINLVELKLSSLLQQNLIVQDVLDSSIEK
jgi:predicted negative regulator of RcsB-dependent stress response